jgi:nitrite reductase (cytochrome c-552)
MMRYFIIFSAVVVVSVLALVTLTAPNRAALGAESQAWEEFHPLHYASFLKNEQVFADRHPDYPPHLYSYVENYPGLQVIWDGIAFSKDYNKPRGHVWSVVDTEASLRPKPGAVCYACKSADVASLYLDDVEGWETVSWDEAMASGEFANHIGCIDCHDPLTHERRISRPFLTDAISRADLDEDFIEKNFESLLCGQCHVEYYFKPGGSLEVTLPWDHGFSSENILYYYENYVMPDGSVGFTDFYNPTAAVDLVKIQHPEFEMFKAGGTNPHDRIGMSCVDCHMPVMLQDGVEIRSHWWTSPLRHVEESCSSCHADTAQIQAQTKAIQNEIKKRQAAILELLAIAGLAIQEAELQGADSAILAEARGYFQRAVFYWDYVAAENSYGFHNSTEAGKAFDQSEGYALQIINLFN